jgi:hypothetical protein
VGPESGPERYRVKGDLREIKYGVKFSRPLLKIISYNLNFVKSQFIKNDTEFGFLLMALVLPDAWRGQNEAKSENSESSFDKNES